MTAIALDIHAPTSALAAAVDVREQWRGQPPGDLERRQALEAALAGLQASWTPEHERYMRRAPHMDRTSISRDPVRVLRRHMRAEEKRLRSGLHRTSGTPRKPLYEPIDGKSLSGRIGRSSQVLQEISREHETIKNVLGRGARRRARRGGSYISMAELNQEALRLLQQLRRERRRLKVALERYERRVVERDPCKPHAAQDEYETLERRVAAIRMDADMLASEIRISAKRKQPIASALPPKRWNATDAVLALHDFHDREGRMPTKYECHPEHGLPHYNSLRRMLGPSPLSS